ncbi:hypothetical protein FSPOR_5039 [Fusarium sporotrichioides]|uniref:Nudix hydrolase domain-containing protein n=1 Tax=Fusarium sporotrichioides TaxID=5514 RepID=A0A395S8V1_FUSSP|nr:hypothetical protein FSPOR_5039 [Fusarium sporotrichioides]
MSTNTEKPVVAIVQGAWHRAIHYKAFAESLTAKGFTVLTPDNVTTGQAEDIKGKTHMDDVQVIRKALQPSLDEGKRIVLVCHSYGGIPGSAAVEGYQLHEREAKGLSGGIVHVVYVASFALPVKGLSLLTAIGGTLGPFLDRTEDVLYLNDGAKDAFYNDLPSEEVDKALAACTLQSTASFETPSNFVATDITVPRTYVVCEEDHAIPKQGQLAMAGAMGEGVVTETIKSGHLPFLREEGMLSVLRIVEKVAHNTIASGSAKTSWPHCGDLFHMKHLQGAFPLVVLSTMGQTYMKMIHPFRSLALLKSVDSGLDPFGVKSFSAHMIGFVKSGDDIKYWVPKRSSKKSTVPSKLDSTVAGVIRSDEQPLECMVSKIAAEASLPAEYTMKNIVSCGTVSYQMDITSTGNPGYQNITSYLYETELKDELVPRPRNDKVCSFTLMNQEEVMAALANGDFVSNRAMVWLAYFVRHGIVTPENEPDYLEVQSSLHKSHEMVVVEDIGG